MFYNNLVINNFEHVRLGLFSFGKNNLSRTLATVMTKEEKLYSNWEYEEEEKPNQVEDQNKDPDNSTNPNEEEELSDDEPIKVKVDGKIVEMTRGELSAGYMRHSDYTRKTQELAEKLKNATPAEKQEIERKANEVVENPDEFTPEDVKAAEILLNIGKKKFGLMTREEYEAEETKKKQVSEFGTRLDLAKTKVSEMTVSFNENGKTAKFSMPAWDEEKVLNHMQETGIHDPYAAYLNMHDAQYRDFIIKQSKGSTSYKSDRGGAKPEPIEKTVDVRTEEGHRSFLSEEIAKMKS